MSRKKFSALILMMLISLTGIIWVQIIWIRNAVGVRNDTFNAAVSMSLNNVAESTEASRRMNFFRNFIMDDESLMGNDRQAFSDFFGIDSYLPPGTVNFSMSITNQSFRGTSDSLYGTTTSKSFVMTGDTTYYSDSVQYVTSSPLNKGELNISGSLEKTGADTSAVFIDRNEFLEWIQRRSTEFRNMSDQMIAEVYSWENNQQIDVKQIASALGQSLYYAGINTPFEFAIIKNGEVQNGTFSLSERNDFLRSNYVVRLFPGNIIRQDLLLSVVFPDKTNYVLGSMAWILGGSLLFSLIILATFAMSLFMILRQKKISEMKSDFINNMTHEFKTPIATISLAADTITNPRVINDESSIRHFVGMIKKENTRMNKKVETILQIASLDNKEIDFRYDNHSLHSIIERAVETISIQVHQKNGSINLRLEAAEPVIYCDAEHMTNLVINLLDNAIKYSEGAPEISVETRNNGNGILLAVTDKGIGMSKNVQSRIFERFYRQTSGNVHDVKGFGLGLNYVRAIVDAHRGTIDVTSEPGKGSRFEVFIPFNWAN